MPFDTRICTQRWLGGSVILNIIGRQSQKSSLFDPSIASGIIRILEPEPLIADGLISFSISLCICVNIRPVIPLVARQLRPVG